MTLSEYEGLGFFPVVAGGDRGAYALVRAFHEAYGIRSLVISAHQTWVIRHSQILRHISVGDPATVDDLRTGLQHQLVQEARDSGLRPLLLGSTDFIVQAIITLREELDQDFVVPYVDQERFDRATLKHNFAELAQKTGVDHPPSQTVDLSEPLEGQLPVALRFPLWAKPADVTAWHFTEFEGKRKVHRVGSAEELSGVLHAAQQAGYRGSFVVQEEVPGDDQNMRLLTCYCDQNSVVRFASWAETIAEEHTPGALGNPAVTLTGKNSGAVDQAQRILGELGWVGYANFDLKYDSRDGTTKFFELNPRLGASSYYVTGAGNNPIRYYVQDWVKGELPALPHPPDPDRIEDQQETVYTILPSWLATRYVSDPQRRRRIRQILRNGGKRNPFFYHADRNPRRIALLLTAQASYVRKFLKHYSPATARKHAAHAPASPGAE